MSKTIDTFSRNIFIFQIKITKIWRFDICFDLLSRGWLKYGQIGRFCFDFVLKRQHWVRAESAKARLKNQFYKAP